MKKLCAMVTLVCMLAGAGCAFEDDALTDDDVGSLTAGLWALNDCMSTALDIYREDNNACPGGDAYAGCLAAAQDTYAMFVDYCESYCSGTHCW